MMLFSYRVRHDSGSAPNPFWGTCTLVICKPGIRRKAVRGDWIVGTGSRNSPVGDLSKRVIYAMRVDRKLTMAKYDEWVATRCRGKLPDVHNPDLRRTKGDAVYDFSTTPPAVRPSVHTTGDREHDLSGQFALLSDRFLYFGCEAKPLPRHLWGLVKDGPGHRSSANAPLAMRVIQWLESLKLPWNSLLGDPCDWQADQLTGRTSSHCKRRPTTDICAGDRSLPLRGHSS
jgi:hypothetical protein